MKGMDSDVSLLYPVGMMCDTEFEVTEATIVAIVTTMNTMSHAMTEMSRQLDAATEAIVILSHELDDLRSVPA